MFFQNNNVINLMICNQLFATSCTHDQDFKANHLIVVNNASYDLVLIKNNRLVVVHLVKCLCESILVVGLPSKALLPQFSDV
jgi:hypothetical protein